MQDVMQDLMEKAQSFYQFFLTNPWPLFIAVAMVVPIYWVKARLLHKSLRANRLAGWSVKAEAGQTAHETGIGMRDALILRPPRKFMLIGGFVILAFGNLGRPYLTDPGPLWPPSQLKDLAILTGFVAFPILGLFLVQFGFMRIVLVDNEIQHKRLFRRTVIYQLSGLTGQKPAGSSIENGVWLEFTDRRRLRIMAFMDGYIDLMRRLPVPKSKPALMVGKQEQPKGQNNA